MARAIWTRRCSGRRLVSPRSRLAFDSHDLARSTVRRISTVARGDIAGVAAGGPGSARAVLADLSGYTHLRARTNGASASLPTVT